MNQLPEVDRYIATFKGSVRDRLDKIRNVIAETAPDATESISYGIAAYKLNNKPLVYFAAYNKHIGFYATPNGHDAFKADFAKYKQGMGSVQFPHDQPLPLELVKRVVEYRKETVS